MVLSKETDLNMKTRSGDNMATIPTLPEKLLQLIRNGENYQIEYKEAWNQLPKSLFDTVCSFSNREGGDIFLGVHDTGVILGVDPASAAKLITDFGTLANNKDKIFPPAFLRAVEYVYLSDGSFSARDKKGKLIQEKSGEHHILHIHIPVSPSVMRHKSRIFDRNGDADLDITDLPDQVYQCYARKQSTYFVNKVYPHWNVKDLRKDLIDRARDLAVIRNRRDTGNGSHPWENMEDEEMLRTSSLILTDERGRTGITLAGILLFGTDNMIASACAHHKTDCIYRVYNLDRYDDRDVIDPTNLLDSYERMFDFGQKHLNDLFVLDGIQSVSARDAILREIISNSLAHRDYSSGYVAKMIIERDRIVVENGNRAHGFGVLDIRTFEPFAKNPPISKIFREIGYADELGSGMRNSYKYTKLYSGEEPEFIEGDVFRIIIPLTTGAMTKVGPTGSPVPGGEVSGEVGGEVGGEVSEAIMVKLDVRKINELLDYCKEAKSRVEIQEFCGIKSQDYFRKNILVPLINSGRLKMTIPDKPKSSKQRYIRS